MNKPLLALLLLSAPPAALGRTIYVAPHRDDGNDGLSRKKPLRSPQAASDRAEPGDRVEFAGGEYKAGPGKSLLTVRRSGEPGRPIVYAAAPGAKPLFRIQGGWEAVKVFGASHLEFRGLTMRGSTDEVGLAEAMREMSNLNNPRTSGNGLGIVDDPSRGLFPTHVLVQGCDIRDFPGGGLFANRADHIVFEGNVVARCAFWAPYGNSGISILDPHDSDGGRGYKIVIRGNVSFQNYENVPFVFSNPDPAKRKVTDGNGIILDSYNKDYPGRTLVVNNVVFENGGSGIHAFKAHGIDVVHNYASDNNRHPGLTDGQIFANNCADSRFMNNVLVAPAGKPVNTDYANREGVVYDYNAYSTLDGSAPRYARALAENMLRSPGLPLKGWAKGGRRVRADKHSPLRGTAVTFPGADRDFFGRARPAPGADIGPFVLPRR